VTAAAISTDSIPPPNGWTIGVDILDKTTTTSPLGYVNLISPQ
jgi:hypothetical protein